MIQTLAQLQAEITVCVTTIDGPERVARLINSIRQLYPSIRIIVGERTNNSLKSPLVSTDADVHFFPYNFSASATKNAIVALVDTKYFLQCDDDYIFSSETDLSHAHNVLEADQSIAIVGGMLFDIYDIDQFNEKNPRKWEKIFIYNKRHRQLVLSPIRLELRMALNAQSSRYHTCDSVLNFALMRTICFHRGTIKWDPLIEDSAENEDFYLWIKTQASGIKVAYCPDMFAYHHIEKGSGSSNINLPERMNGWSEFRKKWDIDDVIDKGDGNIQYTNAISLNSYNLPFDVFLPYYGSRDLESKRQLPENALGIDTNWNLYHTSQNFGSAGGLFLNRSNGQLIAFFDHDIHETWANNNNNTWKNQPLEFQMRAHALNLQFRDIEKKLQQYNQGYQSFPVLREGSMEHFVQLRDNSILMRLLFRADGRPVKALRILLFRSDSEPRQIFKRIVRKKNGIPRTIFKIWLYKG